jgi:hypothetical protein
MFNFRKNAADEIFDNMQKIEKDKEIEEQVKAEDDLVKAMNNLNAAANFFEAAGLTKQAADITDLMISIAAPKKKVTKEKKAPKTKEEKKVFRFYGFTGKDLQNSKDKKSVEKKTVDKKKSASRLDQLMSLGQTLPFQDQNQAPSSIQKMTNESEQQSITPTSPAAPKPAAPKSILSPKNQPLTQQQIKAVQDVLNHTQKTKVDGVWGPESQAALERFQYNKNLPQTGKLDDATYAAVMFNSIDINNNNLTNPATSMIASIDPSNKATQPGVARVRPSTQE